MPSRTIMALFLTMPLSVLAADSYSPQFSRCLDKANGVTAAMIACIASETKVQDARLNSNYNALMASLNESRKKELLEAQRAWLKFRDLNCKFYYDPDGGSIATVSANHCFLNTTEQRASELKELSQP
ncbi:MAG: DUF1311 domain-containing protein [Gammaproteobacteria bacterium]|nr:DUF1311 domain-containing protein [Gammaproteobacteria bacterium]MCP5423598.1 DUF1311 domain-containing protein [Gammaproteobacteria bacterium]MCP5459844.1 DUF1311 domain-containing protein [Gammaproteobacteria bacterium]